jgi:hypothetical protein
MLVHKRGEDGSKAVHKTVTADCRIFPFVASTDTRPSLSLTKNQETPIMENSPTEQKVRTTKRHATSNNQAKGKSQNLNPQA